MQLVEILFLGERGTFIWREHYRGGAKCMGPPVRHFTKPFQPAPKRCKLIKVAA